MNTTSEIGDKTKLAPGEVVLVSKPAEWFSEAPGSRKDTQTHVLFIIDQLCGIGGAERSLLNILRSLPKDRFRCTLVTFKIDLTCPAFENFPCPWVVFPLRRAYGWDALRAALGIRRLIRTQKVHIVHTFFETSDLWGGLVAKLSGVPLLISSRRDMGILRKRRHHLAYRALASLFDLVLAVSDEVREFCIRQDRLDPEKVLTLHNAIEIETIAAVPQAAAFRTSLELAGCSHLITTVGHIRQVKGQDVLIRAAKKVCEEFPQATFLIIGAVLEPPYFQQLQELIESLGLKENIKFMGPSYDVVSFLKISDIYCLSSRSEGFSNALLEAMACSLPCVATRVGGNAEALEDGHSGFLVDSEDSDALADRIRILLRHPERAKEMGSKGRRIVEAKFSMPAMVARLVQFYDLYA